MIYLNEKDLNKIGIDWKKTTTVIENAVKSLDIKDFSQPIKPYLRYKDLKNRIIAMPAYIGGKFDIAGIKWIASFPDNINKGIPRANSVVVLNKSNTGEPLAIINTPLLSIIRTASVGGLMAKYFLKSRNFKNITVGIIGFGPIGRYHLKMMMSLFGSKIKKVLIFDIKKIDKKTINCNNLEKVEVVDTWEKAYINSDIVITCTVSKERYIDKKPKDGSLQLNVSLRDYKTNIFEYVKGGIIVDDWDEVCRENTDIEAMSKEAGLTRSGTYSINDVVCKGIIDKIGKDRIVMFNPMGMGVFDMAIGKHYFDNACKEGAGRKLV
jgi:ornithine cyclodeaminase